MQFLRVSSLLNTPALACEFLAYWLGGTTLSEVGQLLGYQRRQTKALVESGFRDRESATAHYDQRAKRWRSDVPSSKLHGPRSPHDAVTVLRALRIWSRGTNTERLFPVIDTRAFRRAVAPDIFRVLLGACVRKQVVDIVYRARTREQDLAVSFSPHTLVQAAHRDHFRGYSLFEPEGQGHYWDLVPSRVLWAEVGSRSGYVDSGDDAEWNTEATLYLALKADVPDAMRRAIRYEHDITADRLEIGPIPKALLPYVRAEYTDRRYEKFAGAVWETVTGPERVASSTAI